MTPIENAAQAAVAALIARLAEEARALPDAPAVEAGADGVALAAPGLLARLLRDAALRDLAGTAVHGSPPA